MRHAKQGALAETASLNHFVCDEAGVTAPRQGRWPGEEEPCARRCPSRESTSASFSANCSAIWALVTRRDRPSVSSSTALATRFFLAGLRKARSGPKARVRMRRYDRRRRFDCTVVEAGEGFIPRRRAQRAMMRRGRTRLLYACKLWSHRGFSLESATRGTGVHTCIGYTYML